MPDKLTTAAGYGPEFLERARRTCLHVATVIGDMTDDVVLVGGFAPDRCAPRASTSDPKAALLGMPEASGSTEGPAVG